MLASGTRFIRGAVPKAIIKTNEGRLEVSSKLSTVITTPTGCAHQQGERERAHTLPPLLCSLFTNRF